MSSNKRAIKARKLWIQAYEQLGSISKAARKCGIPRSTLYRWVKRVEKEAITGIQGYSKRPKKTRQTKSNW